jgi:tetratricopeptide (TPR) repeat protein
MAVDKNKVIAEATKLVQKGQLDKAIKAYEKILTEDGKDVRVLLKVGELQQKKGDNAAAAAVFSRAADAYSDQGFFLKSVAVYKQMLKLAPDDVRVNERLAGLYQQLGILSDAMGQLQLIASAAEKAGDEPKLLDVLRRMVDLEPDNVGSAVKLGELYAKQSQTKLALEHLRRAAEQLKRNNRADEYVKVAERVAFLAPEDVALTRELANIYLAKGDTKRALGKLQLCFKSDPKDLETLTLLAHAFKDLGQVSKTVSVYKELAHLCAEKGRADDARANWRRVLELAPEDADAIQGVERARQAPAAAAPATAVRAPAAARIPAAGPPPGAKQTPAPPRTASPPVPAVAAPARAASAPVAAAAPAKAAGPEAIPKLLTETDVYLKYGLHEKALEHLKKVFAIDPEHLDAREKAMELRALRNDAAGAAEEAVKAARSALARGLEDRARALVARLRELSPGHPELAALGSAAHAAVEEEVLEAEEDLVLEVELPTSEEADDIALTAAGTPIEELIEEDPAEVGSSELDSEPLVFDEPSVIEEPLVIDEPPVFADEPPVIDEPSLVAERPEPRAGPGPRSIRAPPAAAQGAGPTAAAARPPPPPSNPPAPPVVAPPPPPVTVARPGPGPGLGLGPGPGPGPGPAPRSPAQPRLAVAAPPAAARDAGPPAVAAPPPPSRPPPPVVAAPPPVVATTPGPRPGPRPVVPAPPVTAAVAQPPPPPPPAEQEGEDEEDLGDELEEAEFLIQQGLFDEAGEAIRNLLAFYPDHAKLRAKLADLQRQAAPPTTSDSTAPCVNDVPEEVAEPEVPAPAPPGDDSFDIGRELAEELDASPSSPAADEFQYSVEDVFSQFKRGVAETVKAEDSETHYDLGIAYKEMGLLDDALHEFEVAMSGKSRKKEVDCLTMMGLCHMEKSDAAGAVQVYQRALRSDYLTPEAGRAVHYEIAGAYVKTGDTEAALYYLNKVLKADAGYREVKSMTAQLGGGPGRAPAGVEAPRPPRDEPEAGAPRNSPKKNIGYL